MSPHVETFGNGPDVVLLHGWGLHGGIWMPVRDALAERFTLHIVDLPGHGHSRSARFTGLRDLADQVAGVLPREYALCGWSLGGQVAMALALGGASIHKLLLVSTTPCFAQRADWPHAMTPAVLADFAARLAADYRKTLLNFLNLQALHDAAARRTIHALRDELFARGEPHPDTLSAGLNVLSETDLRPDAPSIRASTLIVHGDRDALTPFGAGGWLAGALPHARMLAFERCAHVPFLSHPDTFVRAATEFLQEP
jgi:pimeloyl-[acyl-carrier protein] methyl ester esterase